MNIYDYVDHADNDKGEENDAMTIMQKTKKQRENGHCFPISHNHL